MYYDLDADAATYLDHPREQRIINLHIPKTAGTLIQYLFKELGLETYGKLDIEGARHDGVSPSLAGTLRKGYRAVIDDWDIELSLSIPPGRAQFDELFKISVVRNPFDYLVSYYHHDFGRDYEMSEEVLKKLGWTWELPIGFHRCNLLHGITSFENFIHKYTEPKFSWCHSQFRKFIFWQLFEHGSQRLPLPDMVLAEMSGPQRELVQSTGPVAVNCMIRYERLEEGLTLVLSALSLIPSSFDLKKFMNSHRPSNGDRYRKHKDYRHYYTDETRELVEKHCCRELGIFGYDFDGPTDDRVLINPHAAIEHGYPTHIGYNHPRDYLIVCLPEGIYMMEGCEPQPLP